MAQIVTITNPLTGQPAQVDQLEHTAQQIDDGIGFESTEYPGCYYRMVSGVVEWFNPPMQINVEYRTTERYMGKPVYVQLVSFGALPNASSKVLDHGIENVSAPFSTEGHITNSSRNAVGSADIWWSFTPSRIIAGTTKDMSTRNAYVKIKYTKNTD